MRQRISKRNRMEISFPNLPENEMTGRCAAAVFAAVLDPTMEELNDFKTAVSEAITNAIIHAYPGSEGMISLRLEREDRRVLVTVTDQGVGIQDIERSMQPLYTTVTDGERSGMGFTFMEAFTDDLEVISSPGQGTRVILSKTMGPAGRDPVEEGDDSGPYL